jgi:hypothetical protein
MAWGEQKERKASGALFRRPAGGKVDFGGEIELPSEVVDSVREQLDAGVEFPKIGILGWQNEMNSGAKYIGLRAVVWEPREPKKASGQGWGSARTATRKTTETTLDDLPFDL